MGGRKQRGLLVRNGREMGLMERKVSERIAAERREQLGQGDEREDLQRK